MRIKIVLSFLTLAAILAVATPTSAHTSHHESPGGDDGQTTVGRQLAEVRRATSRYRHLEHAIEDGYELGYNGSPSVADDLSGLPPACINVGQFDMFPDEDVAYAQALLRAGVGCELHVYPGAFHGSNGFVVDSPLSKRWLADENAALRSALFPD